MNKVSISSIGICGGCIKKEEEEKRRQREDKTKKTLKDYLFD